MLIKMRYLRLATGVVILINRYGMIYTYKCSSVLFLAIDSNQIGVVQAYAKEDGRSQ